MAKRTIEITASVSAVIPTGNYENYKPMYSVKEIIETEDAGDDYIANRTDQLRDLLKTKLDGDYEKLRVERIKNKRQDLRFYPRGNKQYPSVTSIISAIEPIDFDPEKLKQYASRGSLVHAQIDHYFKTGVWENDVLQIPGTKLDHIIVTQGSLGLSWRDCNFPGFWKKHKDSFKPYNGKKFGGETVVYNDEHEYAGEADLPCLYLDVGTLADFKTSSTYDGDQLNKFFRQASAYARAIDPKGEKIKQLMIIPLNPSNKGGFGSPIIEEDIDRYFKLFLQDRSAFRTIYGV